MAALSSASMLSSTPPRTSVTHGRRSLRMRSTPAWRVVELMAHELQEPCSMTSTSPVSTSASTRMRSPPSCCTAGRIMSMSAVRSSSRSLRSSSVMATPTSVSSTSGSTLPNPPIIPAQRVASGTELTQERGGESGREPDVADDVGEAGGLLLHGGRSLLADVVEDPDRDLAVFALGPAADNAAVTPESRPGVAHVVEQRRPVIAQVPSPLLPAHGCGVERRQERHPRLRRADGAGVVGEQQAHGAALQLHLLRLHGRQRLLGLTQ